MNIKVPESQQNDGSVDEVIKPTIKIKTNLYATKNRSKLGKIDNSE